MHASAKSCQYQRARTQEKRRQMNSNEFFKLLTGPELFAVVEDNLPEYRERHYSPIETLSMFLSQAMNDDRSCQNSVNAAAVQRTLNNLKTHSTGTSSYCKARQKLPMELVAQVARYTGSWVQQKMPHNWLWQNRPVKLIDGTTVTLPDTLANQEAFPQQNTQKPGLGFPICRLVGVVCLASGSVLDLSIGPYKGKSSGEHSLLRMLLDAFKPGDIVLGDAYFGSYFLLADLLLKGVDAVFEQSGSRRKQTDFRTGEKLGAKDHLIIYKKPIKKPEWMSQEIYDAVPMHLSIRELKVGKKILVTTLLKPKDASKLELKLLYKDRWHVELDFRNIKTTMGMETLTCKTPAMVIKELWIYILAYNIIRLVMSQSAKLADILPRQISFKHSLQIWMAYRQQRAPTVWDDNDISKCCALIAENIVGNRPGRIEPRAVKRRPKPYPLLTRARAAARDRVRQYGHPKKTK